MIKNKKLSSYLTLRIMLIVLSAVIISSFIIVSCIFILERFNLDSRILSPFLWLFIIFLVSTIISAILSFFIIKFYTKSFDEIKEVLLEVSNGNYNVELELPKKKKKIKYEIYSSFNKLVQILNKNAILKGDFVSNFSHEFKTPITSIKGYAELLLDDSVSKSDKEKYLNVIINEADRLRELSNQTLLLNKLDGEVLVGDITRFDVSDLAMECVLLMDNDLKTREMEVIFNTNEMYINANKNLIKEVIINLISNAIKYGVTNGILEISSYENIDGKFLSFRDNGIGMDEEKIEHIFDRYYQIDKSHNSKGIGLGLSIVKKIMEVSGGEVTVSSVLNMGSIFTLKFKK